MARIALIVGSVRENRQGIKVARWMEGKLNSRNHTVYFIDPLLSIMNVTIDYQHSMFRTLAMV